MIEATCASDRAKLVAAIDSAVKKSEAFEVEHRIADPAGGERFVYQRGLVILEGQKAIKIVGATQDITARKKAESELERTHSQLLDVSRQAGMAEVATGVLHNVGNVLNSVNVSAQVIVDRMNKLKISNVSRLAKLLREHESDIGSFMVHERQGKQFPAFLSQVAEHLESTQAAALEEIAVLRKNIEHIKDIVAMQQTYAKVTGVRESVKASDLVEDAVRMNMSALDRHEVTVEKELDEGPPIRVEKHKVLQILVNLIRNAKYACDESSAKDKRVVVSVKHSAPFVTISVRDNGVGIPRENLTRIFNHGFTTRKDGHGFGLHSGALAAKELGGSLRVQSDGTGRGATFTLEIPIEPAPKS
jgi:C4-dicarboxylate-specific signal transduction histidine kinase